jgi:ppGpp synthetase/RelA/SpoT-type nucleotidyltranferase
MMDLSRTPAEPGHSTVGPDDTRDALSYLPGILDEYRDKALLYHNFCSIMHNLLIILLDNLGFKYQISKRLKSPESIKNKILRNSLKGKIYRRLKDFVDIAGVRIVFYLESDKQRFIKALFKEFTPAKLSMEEHHKEKGYRSTHVVLKFGEKRLSLNEYRNFAGLACELQMTSALYHAWSEIEHDIFYKRDPQLILLDEKSLLSLKNELEDAMINYVQGASEIFETVAKKISRLHKKHKTKSVSRGCP